MIKTEDVQVYPIDNEKLNRVIGEKLNSGNTVYRLAGYKEAIIKTPALAIVDEEFVGCRLTHGIIALTVVGQTTENGKTTLSFAPVEELTQTVIEQYLLPPISLAEFTKLRRHYNPRICGNEAGWLEYFNKGVNNER